MNPNDVPTMLTQDTDVTGVEHIIAMMDGEDNLPTGVAQAPPTPVADPQESSDDDSVDGVESVFRAINIFNILLLISLSVFNF